MTTSISKFKEWNFVKLFLWCNNEPNVIFDSIREQENRKEDLNEARKNLRIEFNEWLNEQVKQVNGKDPICNGSVNKTLSIDEMLLFCNAYKIRLIHNIQVGWGFAHTFNDGYNIQDFKPFKPVFDYSEFESIYFNDIDAALKRVYERNEAIKKEVSTMVNKSFFNMGYNFNKDLNNYGVGGFFNFTNISHISGFITAGGSWNDFEVERVLQSLKHIENTIPKREYGTNNPNTGNSMHTYLTKPGTEYVCVKIDYCSQDDLKRFIQWFEDNKNTLKRINKCDSIRYESNLHEYNGADFELIMWWD